MPRPLLEIWRELNRDRNREPPSSIKQVIADIAREPSSPWRAFAKLNREPSSTLKGALAGLDSGPLSTVKRAVAGIDITSALMLGREWLERVNQIQEESDVAERVSIPPTQPEKPARPSKRKSPRPAGRPHRLTPKQIEDGIHIVRGKPGISLDAAWETLKAAGIKGSKSTVYRFIFKPARS
jgi:hypothetical protein